MKLYLLPILTGLIATFAALQPAPKPDVRAEPMPSGAVARICRTNDDNDGASEGGTLARTDRFGNPLPKNALLRIGAKRFAIEGYAASVAFSSDGKWLAAGDSYGLVYLWEAATGMVIRQFDAGDGSPTVFFSPDGKALGARSARGEVWLWDVGSGKLLTSFQRRAAEFYDEQMLLSSDPTRLIVVGDGNRLIGVRNGKHADSYIIGHELPELFVELLEMPSGRLVKELGRNGPEMVFGDAALSPDGKLLAVAIRAYLAPRKLLRLIDTKTGELIREIRGEGEGWFLSVAFAPDGNTLALGSQDEVVLVDVATGKLVNRLTAKMFTVGFVGFSRDEKTLVSHSHDNKVRLWDLAAGKVLIKFDANASGRKSMGSLRGEGGFAEFFGRTIATALSPDDKTIAVGTVFCVQLWDVASGKQLFPGHESDGSGSNVAFSPDGRLLFFGNRTSSRLWDSVSGDVRKELPGEAAYGVLSPDGKQLAFTRDPHDEKTDGPVAVIWDVAEGKEQFRLDYQRKEHGMIANFAFGPDSATLIATSTHQENAGEPYATMIHRWDTRTGKLLGRIYRKYANSWLSAIAPDGRTAAIEFPHGLMLIDVQADVDLWPKEDAELEGWLGNAVFSPDGGFLFGWSREGYVGLWEIATRSVITRLCLHRDGNINLAKWPMPRKDGTREMALGQAEIVALAISPDGRFVATSEVFHLQPNRVYTDKPVPLPIIRIWDAATGKEAQKLEGFRSMARSLTFSPDGRRLASSFYNDTVLIWDVSRAARSEGTRKKLAADQMAKLWGDLALADGAKAYSAISAFQEAPDEAVDFLTRHVRSVPTADANRVQRLIDGLESERFAEREVSTKELKALAAQFRSALKKALKNPPSLEFKRRIEGILADAPRQLPVESLRTLRSIQTLERIGSAEARRVISGIADGAPEAHETLAAQTALQRLTMRLKNGQ